MHDQLQFHVGSTSPSAARVYFSLLNGEKHSGEKHSDEKIIAAAGKCVGPHCNYAKTLPAEFSLQLATHPATQQSIAEVMILDPCYWSPTLPYTYKVELQLQTESGQEFSYQGPLGMRQWHNKQNSFYLEARRTVLRGYGCGDLSEQTLMQAHEQESALLIESTDPLYYSSADQLGVGLLVDLRKAESLENQIHRLNWAPSAMVAILDAEQLDQLAPSPLPRQCLLAQGLTASSQQSEISQTNPEVLAIELNSGENPPDWLTTAEQPTIAIRRGLTDDQLQEPRRACDQLQTDLAPDFNLAGYFVTT